MKKPSLILTGHLNGVLWIRPEGRGTFQESALIKTFVETARGSEYEDFTIDLEACPGMDSTFMGMLAGLGMLFRKEGKGELSIVGTNDKTKASLMELGVHYMTSIEPADAVWNDEIEAYREDLVPLNVTTDCEMGDHILESHENLCLTDEANFARFEDVLKMFGSKIDMPCDETGEAPCK